MTEAKKIEHRYVVIVKWIGEDEDSRELSGEYHQSSYDTHAAALDEGSRYLADGDPRAWSFRIEVCWVVIPA